ncbi:hypothetical protein KKB40_06265 [Patescibacteria group bacterium]|nr:hypothetical protein [Patescibacteria group bacterium]
MLRKTAIVFSALFLAFGILFTSILRTASIKYEFNGQVTHKDGASVLGEKDINIDYFLAYPGKVLPDSPLWFVKALRDRTWLFLTTNSGRKAELKLLFADKRLGSAKILFEKGKAEVGFSTLTKAEKYLEEASFQEQENREGGADTSEFLRRLSYASLKHFEVTSEIIKMAPEDAKPGIIKAQKYAKNVYENTRDALYEKDIEPPENPFDWQ